MKQYLKLILDIIPPVLFFISYKLYGFFIATYTIIFSSLISVSLRWLIFKHVPRLMVAGLVILCILGGVTIYLNDPVFMKVKPTILYSSLSLAIATSVFLDRNILKFLFDGTLMLDRYVWKKLSLFFSGIFMLCALLNEFTWRNFPEETWVHFKVFGLPTILFTAGVVAYFLFIRTSFRGRQ